MALNKAALKAGIQSLAQNITENEGSYSDFADGMADLIDTFVKSGTVTVAAGIAVATAGSATAQTGATTAIGTGTIS
ncbi:MAG: hypothetical protein ACOYN4_13180 [Bacteroidales bacterium]